MTNNFPWRTIAIRAVQRAAATAILLWPVSGWAQGTKFTPYNNTPYADQKLDARSSPAQSTSDDESSLTSKGYVKIGEIRASEKRGGKRGDLEITRYLNSTILDMAAYYGGDLVRFSLEGGSRWVDSGKTDRVGGSCVVYLGSNCQQWTGGFNVPRAAEEILVSEGTVWRRAAAPHAEKLARATVTLGKYMNSTEMRAWLSSLDLGTADHESYNDSDFYLFKPEGIQLVFSDFGQRLDSIDFYSEGPCDYRQFQGNLPYGLSFQKTREEVEGILGTPDDAIPGGGIAHYKSKGVKIEYMNARVYEVELSIKAVP